MRLRDCHWSLYFTFWLCVIVVGGAAAGAVTFPLVGLALEGHYWLEDAKSGIHHAGFIALVWAPGVALVMSVMRSYKNRRQGP